MICILVFALFWNWFCWGLPTDCFVILVRFVCLVAWLFAIFCYFAWLLANIAIFCYFAWLVACLLV